MWKVVEGPATHCLVMMLIRLHLHPTCLDRPVVPLCARRVCYWMRNIHFGGARTRQGVPKRSGITPSSCRHEPKSVDCHSTWLWH